MEGFHGGSVLTEPLPSQQVEVLAVDNVVDPGREILQHTVILSVNILALQNKTIFIMIEDLDEDNCIGQCGVSGL